ncbi:MAG: hypothetical protein K6E40_14445 [Desulfovibrio sp.]|nr:hypothetical protein [Desulfovibrio sp.]
MKGVFKLATTTLLACLALTGCASHGSLEMSPNATSFGGNATFQNSSVTDDSGWKPEEGDAKIDLAAVLKSAIDVELGVEGIAGDGYRIKTSILKYEPGNAFKRWLMPGYGATKLYTESYVYDRNDVQVAKIPVTRYVGMGGGFTIGAWKEVFTDVARELVRTLKKGMQKPKDSGTDRQKEGTAG